MKNESIIIKSSIRGIFLSSIILFSVLLILIPTEGYALDDINIKSLGIEKTTIITLTNNSNENVKIFRIWLGENNNFESFKTEKGWTGEKTPQGVIIFTTSESIKVGDSVKFGIKTVENSPIINWKALENNDEVISTGVIKTEELPKVNKNPNLEVKENKINNDGEIYPESTFKIVPEKPNSGSTIRITGEQFGPSQIFDFYIESKKLGSFYTDETGFFITTMKLPDGLKDKRVDFKIKNNQNEEKVKSLRIGQLENIIAEVDEVKLTIKGIKGTMIRGDQLEISGTGNPNSSITIKITNPSGITINQRTADVDRTGNWKLSDNILIPFDAELGKYNLIVSDGRNQVLNSWKVETNKVILVNPSKIKFNEGELIKINGTAKPNSLLQIILEDQLGKELASENILTDNSGFMQFEYQTIENQDKEGTWTLIITEDKTKEFVYFGYGVSPSIPINLEFDKLNYQSNENAKITFLGKPSEKLTLMILNPSGGMQGEDIPINLRADGRTNYELNLSGYSSGIYTAIVKKGGSQSSETFSVGLSLGSGPIEAKITQSEYFEGERILLIGNTNPNVLLNTKLMDPSGKIIKEIEIPSNSNGVFSDERLRIPSTATVGGWKITVVSGGNMETIEFNVFSKMDQNMLVSIEEGIKIPGYDASIKIIITASHKTSVSIEILDSDGQIIDETLMCNTTSDFKCEVFQPITKNMIPGVYTVKVFDAISSAETTFEVK